jgi:hypothetical protein
VGADLVGLAPHAVRVGDGVPEGLDDEDDRLRDPLGTESDDRAVEDAADALVADVVDEDVVADVLDAPTVGDALDELGVGLHDGVGLALVDRGALGRCELVGAVLLGAGRPEEDDAGVLADGDGRGAGDEELLCERGGELDELPCAGPEDAVEALLDAGRPGITAGVPLA